LALLCEEHLDFWERLFWKQVELGRRPSGEALTIEHLPDKDHQSMCSGEGSVYYENKGGITHLPRCSTAATCAIANLEVDSEKREDWKAFARTLLERRPVAISGVPESLGMCTAYKELHYLVSCDRNPFRTRNPRINTSPGAIKLRALLLDALSRRHVRFPSIGLIVECYIDTDEYCIELRCYHEAARETYDTENCWISDNLANAEASVRCGRTYPRTLDLGRPSVHFVEQEAKLGWDSEAREWIYRKSVSRWPEQPFNGVLWRVGESDVDREAHGAH